MGLFASELFLETLHFLFQKEKSQIKIQMAMEGRKSFCLVRKREGLARVGGEGCIPLQAEEEGLGTLQTTGS